MGARDLSFHFARWELNYLKELINLHTGYSLQEGLENYPAKKLLPNGKPELPEEGVRSQIDNLERRCQNLTENKNVVHLFLHDTGEPGRVGEFQEYAKTHPQVNHSHVLDGDNSNVALVDISETQTLKETISHFIRTLGYGNPNVHDLYIVLNFHGNRDGSIALKNGESVELNHLLAHIQTCRQDVLSKHDQSAKVVTSFPELYLIFCQCYGHMFDVDIAKNCSLINDIYWFTSDDIPCTQSMQMQNECWVHSALMQHAKCPRKAQSLSNELDRIEKDELKKQNENLEQGYKGLEQSCEKLRAHNQKLKKEVQELQSKVTKHESNLDNASCGRGKATESVDDRHSRQATFETTSTQDLRLQVSRAEAERRLGSDLKELQHKTASLKSDLELAATDKDDPPTAKRESVYRSSVPPSAPEETPGNLNLPSTLGQKHSMPLEKSGTKRKDLHSVGSLPTDQLNTRESAPPLATQQERPRSRLHTTSKVFPKTQHADSGAKDYASSGKRVKDIEEAFKQINHMSTAMRLWRKMGTQLTVPGDVLEGIENSTPMGPAREKANKVIQEWSKRAGKEATPQALSAALREIAAPREAADIVENTKIKKDRPKSAAPKSSRRKRRPQPHASADSSTSASLDVPVDARKETESAPPKIEPFDGMVRVRAVVQSPIGADPKLFQEFSQKIHEDVLTNPAVKDRYVHYLNSQLTISLDGAKVVDLYKGSIILLLKCTSSTHLSALRILQNEGIFAKICESTFRSPTLEIEHSLDPVSYTTQVFEEDLAAAERCFASVQTSGPQIRDTPGEKSDTGVNPVRQGYLAASDRMTEGIQKTREEQNVRLEEAEAQQRRDKLSRR